MESEQAVRTGEAARPPAESRRLADDSCARLHRETRSSGPRCLFGSAGDLGSWTTPERACGAKTEHWVLTAPDHHGTWTLVCSLETWWGAGRVSGVGLAGQPTCVSLHSGSELSGCRS